MTKYEFILKMPDILYHKTWGYAELEFMKFDPTENKVGIFYRHANKGSSYATIKSNWQELYDDLMPLLVKEGHMVQNNAQYPVPQFNDDSKERRL